MDNQPNILQMARAPFLSSIISPLLAGTLLSVAISGSFSVLGFVFVLLMGIGLHVATNVYNDIYDTRQGTDRINIYRNEFSGGSGILVNHPQLEKRMFLLARSGLVVALIATIALMFIVQRSYWLWLWLLFLLAAFFSKYYTAAPVKVAYRGWGEIAVWFAFGPMAILVASLSQNVGFHPNVVAAMPITGISTLSILLLGQMIDLRADIAAGKLGIAARRGTKITAYVYLIVQIVLMINIIVLSFLLKEQGGMLTIALTPYILMLPFIWRILQSEHGNPEALKKAARLNVQMHLAFSILFNLGIGLYMIAR
ncbi:MAG: prenyltransferase [candidate division KSB1 bacterium]|nr:prenyltransferase [candidate division KSB1 bacterium]MDZ7318690.1 prenyltransferase [candidate division KSB1 bacterium]MDZ7342190.1 prenyltransferase [candidate division KSB1 bacterium]